MLDVQHQASNAFLNFVAFAVARVNDFAAQGNEVVIILLLARRESLCESRNHFRSPIDEFGALLLMTEARRLEDFDYVLVVKVGFVTGVHFVGAQARRERFVLAEKFYDAIFQNVLVVGGRGKVFVFAFDSLVQVVNKSFNNGVGNACHSSKGSPVFGKMKLVLESGSLINTCSRVVLAWKSLSGGLCTTTQFFGLTRRTKSTVAAKSSCNEKSPFKISNLECAGGGYVDKITHGLRGKCCNG